MMACFDSVSAQPLERGLEKSPYIRRTLASPIFAISSNRPSTIFAEALSASIRTARRGERGSEGMTYPQMVIIKEATEFLIDAVIPLRQREQDIRRTRPQRLLRRQEIRGSYAIRRWCLE